MVVVVVVVVQIYFYYQCRKQKAKQRTRTVSDGRGGTRTQTETYYVTVLFTFRNGLFSVGQGQDAVWEHPAGGLKLNMSKGFNCTVFYQGMCVAVAGWLSIHFI